jgi:dynein heavy chain, axonemal
MEAVCVMLDIKPIKIPDPTGSGKKFEDYWEPSKKALSDPSFVTSLKNYDKDHIPPKLIETIRKTYTSNPEFTPANAAKAAAAAEGLCKWVCAMDKYEDVAKVVAPKQAALAVAQAEFNTVQDALNIKQVCAATPSCT